MILSREGRPGCRTLSTTAAGAGIGLAELIIHGVADSVDIGQLCYQRFQVH